MANRGSRTPAIAAGYSSFADLAAACVEGVDFAVSVQNVPQCSVAVVAPHAGRIETRTSEIALRIARDDLNLYLLEGKMKGSYKALHLTSTSFDDARCLELLAGCDHSIQFTVAPASGNRCLSSGWMRN